MEDRIDEIIEDEIIEAEVEEVQNIKKEAS